MKIWNNIKILRRGRRLGWKAIALAAVSHILLALSLNQTTATVWTLDQDLAMSSLTAQTESMLHIGVYYAIAYAIGVVLIVPCWCRIDTINKKTTDKAHQK